MSNCVYVLVSIVHSSKSSVTCFLLKILCSAIIFFEFSGKVGNVGILFCLNEVIRQIEKSVSSIII